MRGRGVVRAVRCYVEEADLIQEEVDRLNHMRVKGKLYTIADGIHSIMNKLKRSQERDRFLEGDVARLLRERNQFERETKELRKSVTV